MTLKVRVTQHRCLKRHSPVDGVNIQLWPLKILERRNTKLTSSLTSTQRKQAVLAALLPLATIKN